ncbi:MAG: helix-turn-helix transcriptional regulator [Ruminococcaceae bacterium]|nr:helix-turn-helix transcriptional regulator [Oscillospiraceae bacterium]
MSLGKNLNELRKSKGLTQKELASALRVTIQAISKWENDICYPSADIYPAIAKFYGVSIDRLFGYTSVNYEDTLLEIQKKIKEVDNSGEKIRLINDGIRKFPDSKQLKIMLATVLTDAARDSKKRKEKNALIDKAIALCLEVSADCENKDDADEALCLLCELYMLQGNLNQALISSQQISENNYDKRIKNEATIIASVYDFDNLVLYCKNNIGKCYKTVNYLMELLTDAYTVSNNDEGIKKLNKAGEILNSLYDNYLL